MCIMPFNAAFVYSRPTPGESPSNLFIRPTVLANTKGRPTTIPIGSLCFCVHPILSLPSFYVTTIGSTFTISFLQIAVVKARLTRPDIP